MVNLHVVLYGLYKAWDIFCFFSPEIGSELLISLCSEAQKSHNAFLQAHVHETLSRLLLMPLK